ncbi:probable RING finger protein 207 homolog [Mya arenaria]|nr:probable RING finger protein 207 homolog [Mya arenaria]
MAFASSKEDISKMECSICTEVFREPRSLNCSHIFCETCIQTWVMRLSADSPQLQGIECPLCREVTKPPKTGLPPDKWASHLQRATTGQLRLKSSTDISFCDPCMLVNERNTARYCCIDCGEKICIDCEKTHKRFRPTRDHKVFELTIDNQRSQLEQMQEIQKLLMCDKHSDKPIEFYCEEDEEVFCSTCAFIDHRSCSDVQEIDNEYDQGKPMRTVKKIFTNMKETLDNYSKIYTSYEKDLNEDHSKLKATVHDAKVKLIKSIERSENKLIAESKAATDAFVHGCRNDLKEIKTRSDYVSLSTNTAQYCLRNDIGKKAHFIVKCKLEKRLDQINEQTGELSADFDSKFKRLKLVDNMDYVFPQTGVLGKMEEYSQILEVPSSNDIREMSEKNNLVPTFDLASPAGQLSKQKSYFVSCDFFTDEIGVFSDQRNRRVVMYSINNNDILAQLKPKSYPWTVVTSGKDVLVSFPDEKKVVVFDEHLRKKRELHLKGMSASFQLELPDTIFTMIQSGIASSPAKFDLISGKPKECLARNLKIEETPDHFHLDEERLYWSCERINTVIAYDYQNDAKEFEYSHSDLVWPTGIDTDFDGNIYICGLKSRNIHVLENGGTLLRVFDLSSYNISPTFIRVSENGEDVIILGDANNTGPFFFKLK